MQIAVRGDQVQTCIAARIKFIERALDVQIAAVATRVDRFFVLQIFLDVALCSEG